MIAADVEGERSFLVATDARRRELYFARYDETGRWSGPDVSAPALIPDRQLPVAGEGPMLYPEFFPKGTGPAYPGRGHPVPAGRRRRWAGARRWPMTARSRARPPEGTVLLPPEPLYLRRPDAREPGAPKRVTP